MVVGRVGGGQGWSGEWEMFNGYRGSVLQDEKILEMAGDDVCTNT